MRVWGIVALLIAFSVSASQPVHLPDVKNVQNAEAVSRSVVSVGIPSSASAPLAVRTVQSAEGIRHDNAREQKQETKDDTLSPWYSIAMSIFGIIVSFLSYRRATSAFYVAHRPRIILREAYTTGFHPGDVLGVTFVLANTGGTPAKILDVKIFIQYSLKDGTKRQIQRTQEQEKGLRQFKNRVKIAPGASCSYDSYDLDESAVIWPDSKPRSLEADRRFYEVAGGVWGYFFWGKVLYKDECCITREMAFYRVLDLDSYRFVPYGDPQLEYSDDRS